MPGDAHQTAAARLRADRQRYTVNRRALVEALATAAGPLTITQLLAERIDLAQSSAYRNLAVLERAGVVHRVVTADDHARYELAEELTEHHHHLICDACGAVDDFTVDHELEQAIEGALATVARTVGFEPEHHRLDLVGRCAHCVVRR
jgi:Fe2+ or Zn2+ uptake regulation protein